MSRLPVNGTCRSCGAALIWLRTQKGKAIPVDAASVKVVPADGLFAPAAGHVSHFKTCPHAKQWSKPKPTVAKPPKKPAQGSLL